MVKIFIIDVSLHLSGNGFDYTSTYPSFVEGENPTDHLYKVLGETLTQWPEHSGYYGGQSTNVDYNITNINTGDAINVDLSKIPNGDPNIAVTTLKNIISDIFKNSSTTKTGLPATPNISLKIDERRDSVNTYTNTSLLGTIDPNFQNSGGWKLSYDLNSLTPPAPTQSSPTQSTTPTPVNPTQSIGPTQSGNPTQSNPSQSSIPTTQDQSREQRTLESPNTPKEQNTYVPNIVTLFQPTIKPEKIKFQVPNAPDQQKETAESLGNFPFVWYNGIQIEYTDISYFNLTTSSGIPQLKITFADTMGLLKDKGFPLDDTKVTVFLNPRTTLLKEVHLTFKIVKFSINAGVFNITGLLDVNGLYVKNFKSYKNQSSFEALQSVAKDCGMGFSSNLDSTNDKMTWINTGDRVANFIDTIVESSYKSDKTFLMSYIDLYYCLTYVDLQKEFDRDIKKELGVANMGLEEIAKIDDKERVSRLYLTNDRSMESSNGYFDTYKVINNSTSISIREGYLTKTKFYDETSKNFLIFDVDSITSDGNKSIIMKGQPQDETFFKNNVNLIYTGKLDSDNMHKNYHYSYIQNSRNLVELGKIALEVEMGTPNFTIYKYQKVYIFISNQASTPAASHINNRLSGEWLIIDISYKYDGIRLIQVFKCVKKELELSPEEISSEPPQNNKSQTGQNTSNDDSSGSNPSPTNPTQAAASGLTSSTPVDDSGFPLTKDIFRRIYRGKINDRVIELYYEPIKNSLIKYGMTSKERISAFLAQVNAETNFLLFTTELASGNEYEGRNDLGNSQAGDGRKYKGRGLVQITGRSNYKAAGKFLQKDFLTDPAIVAAENDAQKRAAATQEQVTNAILSGIRYWLAGAGAWGNLNDYADKMSVRNTIGFGSTSLDQLPNSQKDASSAGYKHKKNNNIATDNSPSDVNFNNFALICFAINGGYNGFRERCKNWLQIREYFK
jgi:predicted chitinase